MGLKNRRRSFLAPGCDLLRKGGGVYLGRAEPERTLADRRYRYGDPKAPSGLWPTWCFGLIVFPGHWKARDQPLVIGLKLPLPVLDGLGFLYGYSILT